MNKVLIMYFLLAFILLSTVSAQNYTIGAVTVLDVSNKMEGSVSILESTISMTSSGMTSEFQIVNKDQYKYHITDGVEDFILTIVPVAGKVRGFKYTHNAVFVHKTKEDMTMLYHLTKD